MSDDLSIHTRLQTIKQTINDISRSRPDREAPPELVAVSKFHPADAVREALSAGHRVFGENRVQEAESKWPPLKALWPDCKLHLIGPLQSNKIKVALQVFDVIETVDREKIARALARHMELSGLRPDCFIQVNTGEEPQKAGIFPADADDFIRLCRDQLNLPVIGLMCIPPANEAPAMHFQLLRKIAARNGLDQLSMGMSADFETAIPFGATHVRIGTAIFGPRPT